MSESNYLILESREAFSIMEKFLLDLPRMTNNHDVNNLNDQRHDHGNNGTIKVPHKSYNDTSEVAANPETLSYKKYSRQVNLLKLKEYLDVLLRADGINIYDLCLRLDNHHCELIDVDQFIDVLSSCMDSSSDNNEYEYDSSGHSKTGDNQSTVVIDDFLPLINENTTKSTNLFNYKAFLDVIQYQYIINTDSSTNNNNSTSNSNINDNDKNDRGELDDVGVDHLADTNSTSNYTSINSSPQTTNTYNNNCNNNSIDNSCSSSSNNKINNNNNNNNNITVKRKRVVIDDIVLQKLKAQVLDCCNKYNKDYAALYKYFEKYDVNKKGVVTRDYFFHVLKSKISITIPIPEQKYLYYIFNKNEMKPNQLDYKLLLAYCFYYDVQLQQSAPELQLLPSAVYRRLCRLYDQVILVRQYLPIPQRSNNNKNGGITDAITDTNNNCNRPQSTTPNSAARIKLNSATTESSSISNCDNCNNGNSSNMDKIALKLQHDPLIASSSSNKLRSKSVDNSTTVNSNSSFEPHNSDIIDKLCENANNNNNNNNNKDDVDIYTGLQPESSPPSSSSTHHRRHRHSINGTSNSNGSGSHSGINSVVNALQQLNYNNQQHQYPQEIYYKSTLNTPSIPSISLSCNHNHNNNNLSTTAITSPLASTATAININSFVRNDYAAYPPSQREIRRTKQVMSVMLDDNILDKLDVVMGIPKDEANNDDYNNNTAKRPLERRKSNSLIGSKGGIVLL